jgi:hypothetical protein
VDEGYPFSLPPVCLPRIDKRFFNAGNQNIDINFDYDMLYMKGPKITVLIFYFTKILQNEE